MINISFDNVAYLRYFIYKFIQIKLLSKKLGLIAILKIIV